MLIETTLVLGPESLHNQMTNLQAFGDTDMAIKQTDRMIDGLTVYQMGERKDEQTGRDS